MLSTVIANLSTIAKGWYSVGQDRAIGVDRPSTWNFWVMLQSLGWQIPQIASRYAEERSPRFVVDRANDTTFCFICQPNEARDKCEAPAFSIKIP